MKKTLPNKGRRAGRYKAKGFLEEEVKEKKIPNVCPPIKGLGREYTMGAL